MALSNLHVRAPSSQRRLAVLMLAGGVSCGCPWQVPEPRPTPTIVLTFDDGPLAADIRVSEIVERGTLLAPLHAILETLRRRQLQGVFYIAGPGNTADVSARPRAG